MGVCGYASSELDFARDVLNKRLRKSKTQCTAVVRGMGEGGGEGTGESRRVQCSVARCGAKS